MKRLLTAGLVASTLLAGNAFASSGSATTPNWHTYQSGNADDYTKSTIFVSNISSNTVTVKLVPYNQVGSTFGQSDFKTVITTDGSLTNCTSSSLQCELSPKSSGTFELAIDVSGVQQYGFATVEWSSTDNIPYALISQVRVQTKLEGQGRTAYSVQVNNGQPF